jgi:hypothetical protein
MVSERARHPRGLGGWTMRMQGQPTLWVAKHLCGACHTATATHGHGKQKTMVISHLCPHSNQEKGIGSLQD